MKSRMNKAMKSSMLVFFLLLLGSHVEAQDKQKVKQVSLTLFAQNKSPFKGFANLEMGEVYSMEEASARQSDVDILYTYSKKGTGINLFAPSSSGLKGFNRYKGNVMEAWDTKNRGTFVRLGNDKKARKLYQGVKTNAQLKKAYEESEASVKSLPNYKSEVYGPTVRLNSLDIGDYFIFRSHAEGRDVYAIGHVTDVKRVFTGSVTIDFKILGK